MIKILIAVIVGSIIGFERELHSKSVGLHTITLITVGATLFTILSDEIGDPATARIASSIVTGIGFLYTGVLLFPEGKLKGLTTASSIWAAAALDMSVGMGEYILAGAVTVVIVIELSLFTRFDLLLERIGHETRTHEILYPAHDKKHKELEQLFRECGMRVRARKRMKRNGSMISFWDPGIGTQPFLFLREINGGQEDQRAALLTGNLV